MSEPEATDTQTFEPGYGQGGVPWYLMLLYIGFLVLFTWYVLEYQLPDFLRQGPGRTEESAESGGQ